MALTPTQLEELATWCADCDELVDDRYAARRVFFGEDDPRPARYPPGAGDPVSRERRFLGWYMFDHRLPDGRTPVETAVPRVLTRSRDAEDACAAIAGARYVLGLAETVLRDRVVLELEDERFDVRQRQWPRFLQRGELMAAHLLPVRRGEWLAGPGWVQLPFAFGAGMRSRMKHLQLAPIDVERVLQARPGDEEHDDIAAAADILAFDEAVAEMQALARRIGRPALALSADEWRALVQPHLEDVSYAAFVDDVRRGAEPFADLDQANQVLGLALQIWNATPQPDRGGLSATELGRLGRITRED